MTKGRKEAIEESGVIEIVIGAADIVGNEEEQLFKEVFPLTK